MLPREFGLEKLEDLHDLAEIAVEEREVGLLHDEAQLLVDL